MGYFLISIESICPSQMKLILHKCVFLILCALFNKFSRKLVWEVEKEKATKQPEVTTNRKCNSKSTGYENESFRGYQAPRGF